MLTPLSTLSRAALGLLVAFGSLSAFAQDTPPAENPAPGADAEPKAEQLPPIDPNLKARASYAIGVQIGGDLKTSGAELDAKQIASGLIDAATGGDMKMTEEQMSAAMDEFRKVMTLRAMPAEMRAAAIANEKEQTQFLAANAKKEGVQTTASGLQYVVIKQGEGKKPGPRDTVKVHYHGTLVSGKVFDSSVDRGEPATFPVGGVISGWTEALQLMPVGSKYKIFVPADLAYGLQPRGGDIGPNQMLVFEVELLDILAPKGPGGLQLPGM